MKFGDLNVRVDGKLLTSNRAIAVAGVILPHILHGSSITSMPAHAPQINTHISPAPTHYRYPPH
jgi:hypothetical protein